MTDDELLERFEEVRLRARDFDHRQHVRVAYLCLERYGFIDALVLYRDRLRRFAERVGAPEKYHETVTCALVALIHERMVTGGASDWSSFAAANPDLLDWKGGAFFEYYDRGILTSDIARSTFVLPRGARGVEPAHGRQ